MPSEDTHLIPSDLALAIWSLMVIIIIVIIIIIIIVVVIIIYI